jgi:hypothetical protein
MNLSNSHDYNWALFLPALSSFYISGLGKQREGEPYFDTARIPSGIPDLEALNFLNAQKGLFTYKWVLYSAGHADLVNYKTNSSESIVVNRDRENTFLLADSGGFQILKCQWPADWKDPNCPRAMKKRKEVLSWMDDVADYGMCLDIPSQSLTTFHIKDKKTGKSAHGISTIEEAITATHINNEYFIKNRDGRCKFLNVLQGRNHTQSDNWYQEMKKYCDPNIYPDNHFNGWAFGGQNKIDIHLMLKRLINIIHDGFLEEGKHDLVHCLGTSIMEYAVLFTDIQKAIRKYHNPKFQITFDCASPFFAAAKGLAYNNNTFDHSTKWTYAMEKTIEGKKYANDTRKFSDAVLADGVHKVFTDSPVTANMVVKDLCYRGVGFLGQHGKETKTSWDTLSYTLLQAHNVYQHMIAVQEANIRYSKGIKPKMVMDPLGHVEFSQIVDEIFSLKSRDESLALIDQYSTFWMQIKAGQGFSGKKTVNAHTMFDQLFTVETTDDLDEEDQEDQDSDDAISEVLE